jgi:hypothetical protein
MKLIITKPKDNTSNIWTKSLFETWLWYNDIRTGGKMRFSWNDVYKFYDIWFESADCQPSEDLEKIVPFLISEGSKATVASSTYEYKDGVRSTYPISIRVWIDVVDEASI